MMRLVLWLQGKKTYIAAASIVLLALDQWLTGNASLAEALNEALKGLGIAALRAGVAKTEKPDPFHAGQRDKTP